MISISIVSGNVYADAAHSRLHGSKGSVPLKLPRPELEECRPRRKTERGADVAIALPHGMTLGNGDVLDAKARGPTVVERLPERTIAAKPGRAAPPNCLVLTGHVIGNRHRPVRIENGAIYFSAQAELELEAKTIFTSLGEDLDIVMEETVSVPDAGGEAHDHA